MSDENRDGFKIDSPELADWALGKIREAQNEIDEAQEVHAANVARADEWLDQQATAARATIAWMTEHLRRWFEPTYDDKHKSASFPNGRCGFRKNPPRLDVSDPEAAVTWARAELPAAVRVAEDVDKAAIKAHIKATGEIPDGVDYREGEPTFFATPAE